MAVSAGLSAVTVAVWHWLLENGGILTSAIAGLFGVFTDHKTGRKWALLAVGGVFGGMVWALISSSYIDETERAQLADAVNRVDAYVQKQGNETVSQINANVNVEFAEYLGVRPDLAQQATPQQALALGTAGVDANTLVAGIPADQRNTLTIWVFPHAQSQVNYAVVQARLGQLASHVQSSPLHEQAAVTNSVWYGGGATLAQAKAAALIVVSAGLQIRQICPGALNVPNLIQVGGSADAALQPVLSGATIAALSSPVCAPSKQKN